MFNAKQFAKLNHYANNLRIRNCRIRESVASVERIENVGGKLFCSIEVQDVESLANPGKVGFRTFAVISIGPRGGLTFEKVRKDIY